uniref:Uncharacterized protein n=1 Tax=Glossina brevipalpis TaxID=37001 RepID=A0A1A9WAJ4_9MUSC
MLAALVAPISTFMNFLHMVCVFVLAATYHGGRFVLLILYYIYATLNEILSALGIFAEYFHFACEIDCNARAVNNHVQSSSSIEFECFVECVILFLNRISELPTKAKLFTKLLSTRVCCFVYGYWTLLGDAIFFIVEGIWRIWCILAFIPKVVLDTTVDVADAVVNVIDFLRYDSETLLERTVDYVWFLVTVVAMASALFLMLLNCGPFLSSLVFWIKKFGRLLEAVIDWLSSNASLNINTFSFKAAFTHFSLL